MTGRPPRVEAGLCRTCLHRKVVGNRRGSLFYLCQRAKADPRYSRYPSLPVLRCPGYEEGGEDPFEKEFG